MTDVHPTFPAPDHDHARCAAEALLRAEQTCQRRGQNFTPIRRQVLQALLSSHRPLGAYEIIEQMAAQMARPAPITVYRALEFLMQNGLVHRIESRNAFLACARSLQVPARYVSGYLFSEDAGHLASHAWVEAWLDGAWYSFDVTNGLSRPERHLKLAVGLDYLDACPVRGMRRGGGGEQMHARVLVNQPVVIQQALQQ